LQHQSSKHNPTTALKSYEQTMALFQQFESSLEHFVQRLLNRPSIVYDFSSGLRATNVRFKSLDRALIRKLVNKSSTPNWFMKGAGSCVGDKDVQVLVVNEPE